MTISLTNICKRFRDRTKMLWRRSLNFGYREFICSFYQIWLWSHSKGRSSKSVMLVELNSFHGELIVAYAQYFIDLGYEVTLVVRKAHIVEGVFSRVDSNDYARLLVLSPVVLSYCVSSRVLLSYDKIFFTSIRYVEKDGVYNYVFKYLKWPVRLFKDAAYVIHSYPSAKEVFLLGVLSSSNAFTLSGVIDEASELKMLNPCYFGRVDIRPLNKKRIFITIGSVSVRNRNFQQLLDAVDSLEKQEIHDFEVHVVGRGATADLFEGASAKIVPHGRLRFPEMYDLIESADFFLPLLDPEFEEHRRYLSGETTGSRQLILGFQKPPVIHQDFADVYAFNESNAITYKSANLSNAMLHAMRVDQGEYTKMQSNLEVLADKIRNESKINLASCLS